VRNYGARLDTGYRFGSERFFIDPQATLEYVYTDVDDLEVAGTRLVSDGRTLRGRLGARLGTTTNVGGSRVEASIMPSVWHLLDGDSDVTVVSGGQSFGLVDRREKTYGEISGIMNMFGAADNASGFIKADYRFGGDVKGYGLRAGFRLNW
jgi:outer membrane autotransporter protein